MISNTALKTVAPFVLVTGSAYGFVRICLQVYNSTSLTQALVTGVKRIVIDCTPPVVNYSLLCARAIPCGKTACITGDPNFCYRSV